jgi:hypothetical protein
MAVAIACLLLQDRPAVQAVRPQRTEAEARARAEENRRARRKTGAPVELIADYLAAVIRRRSRKSDRPDQVFSEPRVRS